MLCRLHLGAGTGNALAVDVRQGNAQRIVDAGRTASQHVYELLGAGLGGADGKCAGKSHRKSGAKFHGVLPNDFLPPPRGNLQGMSFARTAQLSEIHTAPVLWRSSANGKAGIRQNVHKSL